MQPNSGSGSQPSWTDPFASEDQQTTQSGGPFTNSQFFNNFDSFITGLKIQTWYNSSSECLNPIFYLVDDTHYFKLNVTNNTRTVQGVIFNVTNILATNFADILPSCVLFGNSLYYQTKLNYQAFNSSVGSIILSFTFNQMKNAPSFPGIFDTLNEYKAKEMQARYWLGIGYVTNIILNFHPLSMQDVSTLTTNLQQNRLIQPTEVSDPVPNLDTEIGMLIAHKPKRDPKASHNFQKTDDIERLLEEQNKKLKASGFQTTDVLYGAIDGAVGAFPSKSLVDLCKSNVSESIYTYNQFYIFNNLQPPADYYQLATLTRRALQIPYNVLFSCYYASLTSFQNPTPSQESLAAKIIPKIFSGSLSMFNTLIANLGFNLGYIYTDVVNILIYQKNTGDLFTPTVASYRLGLAIGDLVMRPFHRDDYDLTFQFKESDLPLPCQGDKCVVVV